MNEHCSGHATRWGEWRKLVETIPVSIFVYIKAFIILSRRNLMKEERRATCSIIDKNW